MTEIEFSLVLAEIEIPGCDGFSLLKDVREVSPKTAGVFMTNDLSVKSPAEAIRLGARGLLIKPLVFDDVLSTIRHVMDHHDCT